MKNILLCISSLCVILSADLSVEQIEKMVSKIHLKREGFDLKTLDRTKEPFLQLSKVDENNTGSVQPIKDLEEKLSLHAIFNGRAFINDSWKSIDDKVMGYTLKHIGKRGVVLRNGNNVKKLLLNNDKKQIIKLQERE